MTQAFNLAQFANNLNTSGQTSNAGLQNSAVTVTAGTGMSGGGSVALGASVTLNNTGVTSVTGAGTVSVSASAGAVTITGTGGSGSVTSVATGNGLQGGTITSSGTLSITAPAFNSVGSYQSLRNTAGLNSGNPSNFNNTNYSGGNCVQVATNSNNDVQEQGNAPGTWRCQGSMPWGGGVWLGVRVA